MDNKETKKEGTVNSNIYTQYFLAGSGLLPFILFMVFNLAAQVSRKTVSFFCHHHMDVKVFTVLGQ